MPMRAASRIAARADVIEHGLDRHFIVAADGEVVLCLALAGPVENQRGYAARQERRFIGLALFLGGNRARPAIATTGGFSTAFSKSLRLAQDAGERLALIGNLDSLARRPQVRKRACRHATAFMCATFICGTSLTNRNAAK